jgi:hypothetical protein
VRAASPSDAFDPRNRNHVFVGPGHPLWLLRGKTVSDVGWLVSAAGALRGKKASARVLEKLADPYVVRKVREAEPALDAIARLPATTVLFAALATDAALFGRLASSVRKDELDFIVRHVGGGDEGLSAARDAKAQARAADAVARERVAKFRRFAQEGLGGLGRILAEDARAGGTLAQVKEQARGLDNRADVLEAAQFRRAAAVSRGQVAGGPRRVEADVRGAARRRTEEFAGLARGMSGLAARADQAVVRLNTAMKAYRQAAGVTTNRELRGWLQFTPPAVAARILGVSVADANRLAAFDPEAFVAARRAEGLALRDEIAKSQKIQYRLARRELVHHGLEAAYIRPGPNGPEVDQDGLRRAYVRYSRMLVLPEEGGDRRAGGVRTAGGDRKAWDFTGLRIDEARAAAMGVSVFTRRGRRRPS